MTDHFLEESKPETHSIGVPNDYHYSNEEQHDFYPKVRTHRQKSHEIRKKHIFKDIAGLTSFINICYNSKNNNIREYNLRLINIGQTFRSFIVQYALSG